MTEDNPRSGRLEFQIKELKEENRILKEALEFYAVPDLFDPVYGQMLSEKTAMLIYKLGNIARQALGSKVERGGYSEKP